MSVHRGERDLMFWERRSPGLRIEPATFLSQTWLQSPENRPEPFVMKCQIPHWFSRWWWSSLEETADYWNSCYTFMTELSSSNSKHDYSCLNYHNINVWHSHRHLNGFPPQQLWVEWNHIQYYFHQAELWNYQLCKTKRTLCIFTNQLCSTATNDVHNVGIHQNPAMYS